MKKRAVIGVINYNNKILVGKKKSTSKKFLAGKWHIPGENVEANESNEQALIRGIKEEAGIEIIVGRYLGSSITTTGKEASWYECFSNTNNVKAGSDLEDIKWVLKEEILNFLGQQSINFWPKQIQDYFLKKQ